MNILREMTLRCTPNFAYYNALTLDTATVRAHIRTSCFYFKIKFFTKFIVEF